LEEFCCWLRYKFQLYSDCFSAIVQPLKSDQFVISKSRYDSIDSYLSPCGESYNDIKLVYDKEIYDQLQSAGWLHAGFVISIFWPLHFESISVFLKQFMYNLYSLHESLALPT